MNLHKPKFPRPKFNGVSCFFHAVLQHCFVTLKAGETQRVDQDYGCEISPRKAHVGEKDYSPSWSANAELLAILARIMNRFTVTSRFQ